MSLRRRATPLHRDRLAPDHCSPKLRREILGRATYFKGLSAEALGAVDERFRERHYPAGKVICREGGPARSLFFVAHGNVKLLRHSPAGDDVVIDLLPQGGLFGGLAALGLGHYPETALAHTDCCLLSVSGQEFQKLLEQYPGVTIEVLKSASRSLNDAREAIRQLTTSRVDARIAMALVKLGERLGEETGQGTLIQVPLPQQDLAAMVGATPETVSRVMARMKREGLVDSGRQCEHPTVDGYRTRPMHGVISVNSAEACVSACLIDRGLIQAPRTTVAPPLDEASSKCCRNSSPTRCP
jgi:CRP-like cAMP-binding protein